MSDTKIRGAAAPLPTLGEGCTRRFDPEAMTEEHGADFSAAYQLWRELQELDADRSGAAQATSLLTAETQAPVDESLPKPRTDQ